MKYAYGLVIELKVPLEMIGQPSVIRMQIYSWNEETKSTSDGMTQLKWITYEVE